MPRDAQRRDLAPVVGEDARLAAVELRERDEVLLPDARRRRGHHAAVELVHARRACAAPRASAKSRPSPSLHGFARRSSPRSRARRTGKPPVARSSGQLGVVRQRRLELDVTGRLDEESRQRTRVVPAAGRERVLGVAPDRLGAERLEPAERLVEPLPDQPLEPLVAAGTFGAEALPLQMAPDDAGREEHRAARPVFLSRARAARARARAVARPRRGPPSPRPATVTRNSGQGERRLVLDVLDPHALRAPDEDGERVRGVDDVVDLDAEVARARPRARRPSRRARRGG